MVISTSSPSGSKAAVSTAKARAGRRARPTRDSRRRSRRPLFCEVLEERRLLTVGFDWAFALNPGVIESGNQSGVADVAVDASGNAYVFGNYQLKSGTVDFDPDTPTTPSTTSSSSFVAKYGPNKNLLWVKELPAIGASGGIAVDATGVYVAGTVGGDLSVDGHQLYSTYKLGIYNDTAGHAFVKDGDVLTITNRAPIPVSTIFEYDVDGAVAPGHVPVAYSANDSNTTVVSNTITAIDNANIGVLTNVNPGLRKEFFTVSYSNEVTLKDKDGYTPTLGTQNGVPADARYWWSREGDVFAAKLNTDTGSVGWTYKADWAGFAGTQGLDDAYRRTFDIAVSNGAVYVAGAFTRQIDLNGTAAGGILTAAQNSAGTDIQDGFVLQLDAGGGTFTDARQLVLPNSSHVTVYGLAVDATSLYVAGQGMSPTTGIFNGSGLWKLQRSNDLNVNLTNDTWSTNVPNPAVFTGGVVVTPRSVGVAPNGDLLVTGNYQGTTDFNPDSTKTLNLTSTKAAKGSGYSGDVFVVRLATDGALKWAKSLGGAYSDVAFDVATDGVGDGNVYTTGYFIRTADFDPGRGTFSLKAQTTSTFYGFEAFVSKLDANGNFVWAGNMGGNGNFGNYDDEGHGIAVDSSGNIYAGGQFRGKGDFNPTSGTFTLDTGGGLSGFLLKLKQSSPLMANASGPETGSPVFDGEMDAALTAGRRRWCRSQCAAGR